VDRDARPAAQSRAPVLDAVDSDPRPSGFDEYVEAIASDTIEQLLKNSKRT
jgi:hypothetical protein